MFVQTLEGVSFCEASASQKVDVDYEIIVELYIIVDKSIGRSYLCW